MKPKNNRSRGRLFRLRPGTLGQLAAILTAGCAIGLAYNASNPIGIRWQETARPVAQAAAPTVSSNTALAALTTSATAPTLPVSQPAAPAQAQAATNSAPVAVPPQYAAPSGTTWAEVKPRAEKKLVVLVDARAKSAYDASHIPDAINLPEPPPEDQLAAFRAQYPTNAHIVVYCSSTSCSLSFKLAHRLAREGGYGFVQYMTGGFMEWQREETLAHGGTNALPASDSAPVPVLAKAPAREIVPNTNPSGSPTIAPQSTQERSDVAWPIRWSEARPLLGAGQAVLLDARPKDEFDAGHIPGSLWLAADASPEVIKSTLDNHPRTTRWVAYCDTIGCQQGFQLAVRLVREFDYTNALFLTEGYAEWKRAERAAMGERAAR